jgi:hypothetical protein
LAGDDLSLGNTVCKAGKRRGKNTESKKIQDSLSGDHREEEVSTSKRCDKKTRAHWQEMREVWRILSAKQGREKVRIQKARICRTRRS